MLRLANGHIGYQDSNDDTFTITNPTTKKFAIFGQNWVSNFGGLLGRPLQSANFLSTNDWLDYSELVLDLEQNPKKIKAIRIIADNFDQLITPLLWQSRDSNGEVFQLTDFPVNLISPMQFQGRMIDLEYERMIVGINQFITYTLIAGSTVTFTFIYDDFDLSDLLYMKTSNIFEKKEI